jgi:hypothetical protein
VALVTTEVSEEGVSIIIRMKSIGELGITLAITSNRTTLRRTNSISSSILVLLVFLLSVLRSLITAVFVTNSPIIFILLMEAMHSSETSFIVLRWLLVTANIVNRSANLVTLMMQAIHSS